MSASLVGSEMCIRDRCSPRVPQPAAQGAQQASGAGGRRAARWGQQAGPCRRKAAQGPAPPAIRA
eukprot:11986305-Alexandrium_andersonii.AAC.1